MTDMCMMLFVSVFRIRLSE